MDNSNTGEFSQLLLIWFWLLSQTKNMTTDVSTAAVKISLCHCLSFADKSINGLRHVCYAACHQYLSLIHYCCQIWRAYHLMHLIAMHTKTINACLHPLFIFVFTLKGGSIPNSFKYIISLRANTLPRIIPVPLLGTVHLADSLPRYDLHSLVNLEAHDALVECINIFSILLCNGIQNPSATVTWPDIHFKQSKF